MYFSNSASSADTQIGIVNATDKDLPPTGISYSIVAGGSTLDYSNIFWIDSKNGIVKLLAMLDYETDPSYLLIVMASDNDGRSAIASVSKSKIYADVPTSKIGIVLSLFK